MLSQPSLNFKIWISLCINVTSCTKWSSSTWSFQLKLKQIAFIQHFVGITISGTLLNDMISRMGLKGIYTKNIWLKYPSLLHTRTLETIGALLGRRFQLKLWISVYRVPLCCYEYSVWVNFSLEEGEEVFLYTVAPWGHQRAGNIYFLASRLQSLTVWASHDPCTVWRMAPLIVEGWRVVYLFINIINRWK